MWSSIIFNWCLQSLLIMFRAKLVVMGPGFSQHGEVHLHDEDERRLEYKISFFKWQIEEAGYWCDIQRYVDWKYPQFGLSTSCWFLRAKSVDGFFIVVAILNQKFTCDISWTIWICANQYFKLMKISTQVTCEKWSTLKYPRTYWWVDSIISFILYVSCTVNG